MKGALSLVQAIPALSLLLYLLLSEPPAIWLLFFSALIFHEWGHLCAFFLLGICAPTFRLRGVGARLCADRPLLAREEALVALAGPLFNILLAVFSLCFLGDFGFLCAAVHLLFAIGNLLPFGGCDGERLLRLFLLRTLGERGERITNVFRVFFLSLFFYLSLFLFFLTGNGLCGILFSVFFLLEPQNSPADVF